MDTLQLIILPDEVDSEAAEVLVDGSLEDHGYRFLLDTGAAQTRLQYDSYTGRFPGITQRDSSGVFAEGSFDLITVPHLRVGPIVRNDFTLVRAPVNAPGGRNLVGMDLLKDYRLRFLFDESRVVLDPLDPLDPLESDDTPQRPQLLDLFLSATYHPYIPVQFEHGSASAVWDTGAGITVADTNFIQRYPMLFQEIGRSTGTDSTGTAMQTPLFEMTTSMIGGRRFPAQKVAGVDLSRINVTLDTPIDLILGYSTIHQANWIFDFPHKMWGIVDSQGV